MTAVVTRLPLAGGLRRAPAAPGRRDAVPAPTGARYADVDALLAAARADLPRVRPVAALAAVLDGAGLVDIRPGWQRTRAGEIPGALVVERNHLEWRLHPGSAARLPHATATDTWIVLCSEGYTSSLAAAALRSLGLAAADLEGGFHAWAAAGLPVTAPGTATPVETVVPGAARLLAARGRSAAATTDARTAAAQTT